MKIKEEDKLLAFFIAFMVLFGVILTTGFIFNPSQRENLINKLSEKYELKYSESLQEEFNGKLNSIEKLGKPAKLQLVKKSKEGLELGKNLYFELDGVFYRKNIFQNELEFEIKIF